MRASGTYWLVAAVAAALAAAPAQGGNPSQVDSGAFGVLKPVETLPVPAAEGVRAYDKPSDEGTAIIVEWPRPEREPAGLVYVVEAARSAKELEEGKGKRVTVKPGPKALKSADPKTFGFSAANKKFYRAEIEPAELFKPEAPKATAATFEALAARGLISKAEAVRAAGELKLEAASRPDPEWLGALSKDIEEIGRLEKDVALGRLTGEQLKRAARAIRDGREEKDLTGAEKADRQWLEHLRTWIGKKHEDDDKDAALALSGAKCYLRLGVSWGGDSPVTYVRQAGGPLVLEARARPHLFKWYKLNNLVFSVLFGAVVLAFLQIARRNPNLFIRRIAGLDAVDEAIGRATEMGRPVYFVHGLGTLGDLATVAALTILGRIARRAAEYDTRVRVMCYDAIVTAVSQEVVQQAYTEAGRPDAYNPDEVSLVSSDQFAYVAAVGGMMTREQPAAIFMVGTFFAESLYLAETGASTGAIQIAGTDAYTQLPFFITTCDYTLIGEEVYAASAYLSREPRMLGSLRGQDVGKAFLMAAMVAVTAVLSIGAWRGWPVEWLAALFKTF